MIVLNGITKSFNGLKAVESLSFHINSGEVVGFLGPNGAGKTTTMRMIAGFLYPDTGSISVDGIPVSGNDIEIQRLIGYMPENNPLYKDLIVSEFLQLSADLKGIEPSKKKDAFDFVVTATNLSGVFYRPIRELSKGFRQRVGFACALLHKPKVLILDEPTEGLDPNQRAEVRELIKELSKDHTIVLSTHVMQEVSAVCKRLLIINRGQLIADGSTDELISSGHDKQAIEIHIEGEGAEQKIKEIEGVEEIYVEDLRDNIKKITIKTEHGTEIRPYISKLLRENEWTLWRLAEEKRTLEEVFQRLTQNNHKTD